MTLVRVYSRLLLLYFCWFINCSLSQGHETMVENRILNVGEELWEETLPLRMGFQIYELPGLKSSTWYEVKISYPASIPSSFSIQLKRDRSNIGLNSRRKLLNTEKLIFRADDNTMDSHQGAIYLLVTVEPDGVVAIPHASEGELVMFNIACEELLLGIPHKAWLVVGLAIFCLALALALFLPSHLLEKTQSICSAASIGSKDF